MTYMDTNECAEKIGHCWFQLRSVSSFSSPAGYNDFRAEATYRRKCRHCNLVQQLRPPEYEDVAVEG